MTPGAGPNVDSLFESIVNTDKVNTVKVNTVTLKKSNPRLMVWSPLAAAVLGHLADTIPRFSVSGEARKLLEAALEEKYPELVEEIKRQL